MSITSLTNALLAQSPAVPGLDESIVIAARRLHLTLGVMSLTKEDRNDGSHSGLSGKTVPAAIALLEALQPRIADELGGGVLQVPLTRVGIMKPERGNIDKAHVMFAGPAVEEPISEEVDRLKHVCGRYRQMFIPIEGLSYSRFD